MNALKTMSTAAFSLFIACSICVAYAASGTQGSTTQSQSKSAQVVLGSLPRLFSENFENGMTRWVVSDAKLPKSVWSIESCEVHGKVLRVAGASDYKPPHRSPFSFALIKDVVVGDFELVAKVQNTNTKAGGHRDLCFFWGYQDPAHFYYVHLGAVPDPHSSQVFIVNEAPRTKITTNQSPGIPWTDGWHKVKVVRKVESGETQVYFDDMTKPVLTAKDTTFRWGRVGIGTFDDHGNFAEVKLYGDQIKPIPPAAQLP